VTPLAPQHHSHPRMRPLILRYDVCCGCLSRRCAQSGSSHVDFPQVISRPFVSTMIFCSAHNEPNPTQPNPSHAIGPSTNWPPDSRSSVLLPRWLRPVFAAVYQARSVLSRPVGGVGKMRHPYRLEPLLGGIRVVKWVFRSEHEYMRTNAVS
jgi:hypothetical protein